ncbi:ABC transporter permease [Mycoavidus sp. B2-EB]|uniref:ABC transporter permease n=1 Tax=Mycoavidus sp. B2-EB TaxID=2651972 RepID=UPI001627DFF4|nr:ABC transporter permease [Mycoavidus sp. B2-EB]BBO59823.1 ABC transporter permease [Mycoavidus sp. B2-EB]
MNTLKSRTFPGVQATAIFAFLFLYTPIIVLVFLSFNQSDLTAIWQGFSLNGYVEIWQDPYLLRAAQNSLIVASSAMLVSTLAATLAALALRGHDFIGKSIITTLIGLPLLAPGIVIAVAALMFFSFTGLEPSLITVIVTHIVFCIPFAYLPIQARLSRADPHLIDAAKDLYANPWRVFWRVTWPQLMPGVTAGALLAFITSMDDFIITYFVAGPGATTLPIYIFETIGRSISPKINAVSTLILGISVLFIALAYFIGRQKQK